MFKTETHLHTSEGSGCARMSAEEMVMAYHNAGFKTLFISNHFGTQFFKLMDETYSHAVLSLEVEEENEQAVHVYKKCGFEVLPYMEMKKEV